MLVLKGAKQVLFDLSISFSFLYQAHENETLHWRFLSVRDSFLVGLKDKQRKNTEFGTNALA